MCPAIAGTSSFPTLLVLLLLLFHPGLQAPTTRSPTKRCNRTILELSEDLGLDQNGTLNIDDELRLCNDSFWRKNLCVFLSAVDKFPNATDKIKKNLEFLKRCVPEPHFESTGKPITIGDWNDFRKKLRFYLGMFTCDEPRATQNTSQKCSFVPVFPSADWTCPQQSG